MKNKDNLMQHSSSSQDHQHQVHTILNFGILLQNENLRY